MKKFKNRISIYGVILSFFLSMILSCGYSTNVFAANHYSGGDYTDDSVLASRLDYLINDCAYPEGAIFNTTWDTARECCGYAFYAEYILFGESEKTLSSGHNVNTAPGYPGQVEYSIRDYRGSTWPSSLTYDWSTVPFGSHVRGMGTAGSEHSLIFLKYEDGIISYIDANGSGTYNKICLHEVSVKDFFEDYLKSVKYIRYPENSVVPTYEKEEIVSGGTYIIQNVGTKNFVNVWANDISSIQNSTKVTTYPSAKETTQYFTIYNVSNRYGYKIVPYSSSYAINCTYRTNGLLNTYNPNLDLETWYISDHGNNYSVRLESNFFMFWTASTSSDYGRISLSSDQNSETQVWKFIRIE